MGLVGLKLWWSIFFAMAVITAAAAARNSILLSDKREVLVVGMEMNKGEVHGKFVKLIGLEDYNDPSANHGHDPIKNRGGGGGHKGGHGSNNSPP